MPNATLGSKLMAKCMEKAKRSHCSIVFLASYQNIGLNYTYSSRKPFVCSLASCHSGSPKAWCHGQASGSVAAVPAEQLPITVSRWLNQKLLA
mmetsp:Transcript_13103/g.25276  ORF Transcript_13103/g.25276 Transcript_13103/m.25276 type:complete len:93 (-) Transcript_13103:813-1091(-)